MCGFFLLVSCDYRGARCPLINEPYFVHGDDWAGIQVRDVLGH